MAAEPLLSSSSAPLAGGSFLLEEVGARPLLTPEGFSDEQRLYLRTGLQFLNEQVLPKAERIEGKDNALLRELLRQAGEVGLLMVDVPEAFGGLGLDKTTSLLVGEAMSGMGSWAVTHMAHVGIGTLPIAWFGTEAQRTRFLPKLASGEWIASYALTEPGSGSDALAAKTQAVLSEDGQSWILNGSKLYITNAGFSDVFVVFAKVQGEQFSAFIVEKGTPGFSVGPEEHKMGLRGSSTCPLYFEDARIPKDQLLGEIGKGHKIAFNILNYGRLKLGAFVLGSMKMQLAAACTFAQERKQFQTPVIQFPLTREKLARMAARTYAVESICYRTTGLVDQRYAQSTGGSDAERIIAAIEEYAIEASIIKVFASEANAALVDDAVQIHGGAGFIEEYPVERAYRDSRVNLIFEGTNEINRMLISSMLLKRAAKPGLPLLAQAQALEAALKQQAPVASPVKGWLATEVASAESLKQVALYALKAVTEAFGSKLDAHQAVLAAISDIVMDAYVVDSMVARALQHAGDAHSAARQAMTQLYNVEARARTLERAQRVLCACAQDSALALHLKHLNQLLPFVPYEPAALREAVVQAVEAAKGYPLD